MRSIADVQLEASLTGHQNPIFALAQPDDRSILYTGGNDKGVVEWDLKSQSFKRIVCKVGSSVYKLLAISGTNMLAVGMRSGQVLLLDTVKMEILGNWKTESGAIFDILYLKGKQELLAIGEEGYAYVWSLENKELLYRFKVANDTSRVIAMSTDERFLAFGDKQGYIHLHDAHDFHVICKEKIHELPVTSLKFIGNDLVSGGRDAKLYLLNPKNLEKVQDLVPHMFTVYGIAASEDMEYLATASRDKTLKIWKSKDWTLAKNISRDRGFDSHYLSINNVLWNEDRIFTVSDDKQVKIWKVDFH
ncbi:hypothetical protein GCM10022216_06420 [Sphingobacterium kyonggiense]|uniref:WD-40 repeat-containing protein n=1 Tax=Sphingobacterium kyonggiense TaxID=714075 RepID=A0ABP7YC98_9SPHI